MDVCLRLGQDCNQFPDERNSSEGMVAAQMSSSSRIVAQVPFEFVAANRIVPAGEWVVKVATSDGNTLAIGNADSKINLFAAIARTENEKSASHYALVFEKYGDQYFLAEIKVEGSKMAYRLPESRAEAELRAQNMPATEEILLAAVK